MAPLILYKTFATLGVQTSAGLLGQKCNSSVREGIKGVGGESSKRSGAFCSSKIQGIVPTIQFSPVMEVLCLYLQGENNWFKKRHVISFPPPSIHLSELTKYN